MLNSLVTLALAGVALGNLEGCVTNYDANTDYFPDKVQVTTADTFTVEYKKSYKIIEVNKKDRIVAYQCGTPAPDISGMPESTKLVSIPVKKVGFVSTVHIPFIELLGERESITVALTKMSYVSSPCLIERFNQGHVKEGSATDENWNTVYNETLLADIDVAFVDKWTTGIAKGISLAEADEKENLGKSEYLKYFSVFYNKEAKANELYNDIVKRTKCLGEYGKLIDTLEKPTQILWCNYAVEGWKCGNCPNYYCEAAKNIGAELLDFSTDAFNATVFASSNGWYSDLLDDSEFLRLATDADMWIYTGTSFLDTYNKKKDVIQKLKVYKNREIFGTDGMGSSDWFESRLVEPDVVMEDMLAAAVGSIGRGKVSVPVANALNAFKHTPVWIQNVWLKTNEIVDGSKNVRGLCVDTSAPAELQANECVPPVIATHIAGYEPYSNVAQHAQIDLDQKILEEALATSDWAAATQMYSEGKSSTMSYGLRSLKGFSVNQCKQQDEKYFKTFNAYWTGKGLKDCEYANDIVSAALSGSALGLTGFTFADKDDEYRQEAIQKSTVLQNTFMYTIWEMEDAIKDCKNSNLKDNDNSVHSWDEAVAFYTGSLEGPIKGGEKGLRSGTAAGKLLYNLAEKRCQDFGTCTGDFDGSENSGYSKVNSNIFQTFSQARESLDYAVATQNFECPGIFKAKDEIVSQMVVPLVQGTLRSLYKTDKLINAQPSSKELGELFAFASGVLPLVSSCDAAVAQNLMDRAWSGAEVSFEELKKGLESTYSCLGITCRDVGALCDTSSPEAGCKPYLKGPASYDTSMCDAEKTFCDENFYCVNWAKDGFCASNQYVKDNCKGACANKDHNVECKGWVEKDSTYCVKNNFVAQYCPESCVNK